MPLLLESLSEDILNDIVFLTQEEKTLMLEFFAKECVFSISGTSDTKVAEVKLVKVMLFAMTGHKIWSGKMLYSERELDSILRLYDRAPEFIQDKLEPLMKEFKEEVFGSLE
jgi:hypothetical protein